MEKKLSPEEIREKLRDPNFLPTQEQITEAFDGKKILPNFEEWDAFILNKENRVYEIFTKEYMNALGDYLSKRIEELGHSENNPVTILEIGAGNGRLSHLLRRALDEKAPKRAKIVATDLFADKIKTNFPVENLGYDEALKKYQPDIVICSWMPFDKDFSQDIRSTDSVKEYILIGEDDHGCCGKKWETWGLPEYDDEDDKTDKKIPPYAKDGFYRKNHREMNCLQVCRSDTPGQYFHSRTTSFKRKD